MIIACRPETSLCAIVMSQPGSRPIRVSRGRSGKLRVPSVLRRNAMTGHPSFERPHCVVLAVHDLAYAVEPNQLEHDAHGFVDIAEFQVAAVYAELLQTRQNRPATAAVDELDTAEVDHQLAAVFDHLGHLLPEVVRIARVQLVLVDGYGADVADPIDAELHGYPSGDFFRFFTIRIPWRPRSSWKKLSSSTAWRIMYRPNPLSRLPSNVGARTAPGSNAAPR